MTGRMRVSEKWLLGLVVLVTLLGSAPRAEAGLAEALPGLAFGSSEERVRVWAVRSCDAWEVRVTSRPTFPLAAKSEAHVVCFGLPVGKAKVSEAAFTFADGRLVLFEARGGAVEALTASIREEPQSYLHYRAYFQEQVVADVAEDAVWFLTPESLHLNLFTWSNPALRGAAPPKPSAALPDLLQFGGRLETLFPLFEEQCALAVQRVIAEPWLPSEPEEQVQIDCFGFDYAGFPRKIEAVFGDGELQLVWILTGKGEEARLRQALEKAFGEPEYVGKDWEAFQGWRVALRKDKPEILALSQELAPLYKKTYETAAASP